MKPNSSRGTYTSSTETTIMRALRGLSKITLIQEQLWNSSAKQGIYHVVHLRSISACPSQTAYLHREESDCTPTLEGRSSRGTTKDILALRRPLSSSETNSTGGE